MRGLLDVTDNLTVDGVVPPADVVRHDDDDPYLVVAADKGTATFSDIANGVSRDYGFWLDDAFASGGSAGYDHKGMGITARGAWEAVQAAFPRAGRRRADAGLHRRRRRRHVGRRVRQRHAALAPHAAAGRLRPPPHLCRSRPRSGEVLRRARAPVQPAALVLGGLRFQADLGRRRRLRAQAEIDQAVAGDAARACRRGRGADAGGADPRGICARRSTCCGSAASAPTSRRRTRRMPRSATAPTMRCASTGASCARAWSARAPISASPSAAAWSSRNQAVPAARADASTPTRSTIPPASTRRTTRSTSRSCSATSSRAAT